MDSRRYTCGATATTDFTSGAANYPITAAAAVAVEWAVDLLEDLPRIPEVWEHPTARERRFKSAFDRRIRHEPARAGPLCAACRTHGRRPANPLH